MYFEDFANMMVLCAILGVGMVVTMTVMFIYVAILFIMENTIE